MTLNEARGYIVEIDTQWNVNEYKSNLEALPPKVEIDTQWNVNWNRFTQAYRDGSLKQIHSGM